jgi:LysM repeat protein
MATVTIGIPRVIGVPTWKPRAHPKAFIQTETGARWVFPYAPRESEHGGDTDEWAVLPRSGRKPLVRRNGAGLRTLQFSFLIASSAYDGTVEGTINNLRTVVGNADKVLFSLGYLERGWWRVTDLQVSPLARQEGTNQVTRANVSIQLIEAYDVRPKIGRTATRPKPKPPAKTKPKATSPSYRYVTVRRGDTLWDFAVKYLGTGLRWKEIAKLNGVRDPKKLQIGKRLRIPPK